MRRTKVVSGVEVRNLHRSPEFVLKKKCLKALCVHNSSLPNGTGLCLLFQWKNYRQLCVSNFVGAVWERLTYGVMVRCPQTFACIVYVSKMHIQTKSRKAVILNFFHSNKKNLSQFFSFTSPVKKLLISFFKLKIHLFWHYAMIAVNPNFNDSLKIQKYNSINTYNM